MAARGNRVICVDLLATAAPTGPTTSAATRCSASPSRSSPLLDHLEVEQAVVGGTSLGATWPWRTAALAPDRVRGMFIEMPVLDNALVAVAVIFNADHGALRFGKPVLGALSALLQRVPRTFHLLDIGLDWVRQEPGPSLAVLEGLLLVVSRHRRASASRSSHPALIIGHAGDPLHPFTDAGMLADELDERAW